MFVDRHKDAVLSVVLFWMYTELVMLLTYKVTMPYSCRRSKKFINFELINILTFVSKSSKLSQNEVYSAVYFEVYLVELHLIGCA